MFNSDLTKHLAELSKLEFTDEELEQMTADMTNIIKLSWIKYVNLIHQSLPMHLMRLTIKI